MNHDDFIKKDNQNIMATYARFPVVVDYGEGSTVFGEDGKQYIDFTSGIGVNSIGYKNEAWVTAIKDQACKLAHMSNLFYTKPQIELAEKLVNISGMKKVFFCNSGAEANEGAIKLARKYSFDKYGLDRANIITLNNSFHGRTITTLKATGQDKFHNYFFPFTEGFIYAKTDIEDVKNKINDTVCAIMLESIQGEGGVMPLSKDFVKAVFELCKQKDILVIFDEVQTGIARTGKMFGFENFDVCPDICTVAKGLGAGLPIGAFLCNDKLQKTLGAGDHGTTFGGNPICCSGANVVLDIVSDKSFLEEVVKKGDYIKNAILKINSKLILDVRGIGLMLGIVLDTDNPKSIVNKGVENGVLMLTAGKNVVRLLPPLTISYEEIDKGLQALEKSILEMS